MSFRPNWSSQQLFQRLPFQAIHPQWATHVLCCRGCPWTLLRSAREMPKKRMLVEALHLRRQSFLMLLKLEDCVVRDCCTVSSKPSCKGSAGISRLMAVQRRLSAALPLPTPLGPNPGAVQSTGVHICSHNLQMQQRCQSRITLWILRLLWMSALCSWWYCLQLWHHSRTCRPLDSGSSRLRTHTCCCRPN